MLTWWTARTRLSSVSRLARIAWVLVAMLGAAAPASALELCGYDAGGGDCGNGVFTCSAGYTPACDGLCEVDGACNSRCQTCNCIAGYSPGNSITVNIGAGSAQHIIAFCSCKRVENNHASGKSIMVPTKTTTEWSSFFNNPPSGVGVTNGSCM